MSEYLYDFEKMLLPVSDENPGGTDIEYDNIHYEIKQARESDTDATQEEYWTVAEPRVADWNKVKELCERVIIHQSKDLQVACWYIEALAHVKGREGISQGLVFLKLFLENFWSKLWPSLEQDDSVSVRYSKISRLDRDLSQYFYGIELLKNTPVSTLSHFVNVKELEDKIKSKPELREELLRESEGELSLESFTEQLENSSPEELTSSLQTTLVLLKNINEIEVTFSLLTENALPPLFNGVSERVHEATAFLKGLLQSEERIELNGTDAEITDHDKSAVSHVKKDVMTREHAIQQMYLIAQFFRKSEPSSPVPFLMERATRWANMNVTEWLEEMLSDRNSIEEINNVLKGKGH